ncbi:MAG TPA: Uma2 family endonuclease [Acetobacteraceae bacterium]|nr:Uma2 family endonuclease [Acetobacteraceae bacterium]
MTVALRKPMTLSQFLDWEERQELRYEFDGFQPVAMTGGTLRHELLGNRLRALLMAKLEGKRCRLWGPTTKIEVQGRIRYPDAFVSCTAAPLHNTIVPEPVVVFEILSTGTSRTDRIEKLQEYQATRSIMRYLILEQDSIAATVFVRQDDQWTARARTRNDVLDLPEIGIELALADIYADAQLEATDSDGGEPGC